MTTRRIKKNKRWTLLKFVFTLCLVFGLFALVWLRTTVVNLEYELGELDKQKVELIRERKIVVAQRASFYSAKRIEDFAIKRLGMSLPERENVFFVKRTAGAGPYTVSVKSNFGDVSGNKSLRIQRRSTRQK